MVLESILEVTFARKHPLAMLFVSIVISSICIWTAYLTFPEEASVLNIAFMTTALVPLMYTLFVVEENELCDFKPYKREFRWGFLTRHFDVIKIYSFFFIGLIISYSFWYVALPADMQASIFSKQDKAVNDITSLRQYLTGNAAGAQTSCGKDFDCYFGVIFTNNSGVLFWAILFSFMFGAGSIFLIGWNASIIGTVVGRDIAGLAASYQGLGQLNLPVAYLHGLFNAVGFVPHGLPELTSYFVGAIAGGIISAAISKKKYRAHELPTIAKDALFLLAVAFGLLLIAAAVEAWLIVSTI